MAKEKEAETSERIYTIPLRREWLKAPRNKRASRAVATIKDFLFRHMKAADVKISQRLNEQVWVSGIQKPPAKIKLKARIEDGVVTARLPDEMVVEKEDKKGGRLGGLKDRLVEAREGKLKPGAEEAKPKETAKLGKEETAIETEPEKKDTKKETAKMVKEMKEREDLIHPDKRKPKKE